MFCSVVKHYIHLTIENNVTHGLHVCWRPQSLCWPAAATASMSQSVSLADPRCLHTANIGMVIVGTGCCLLITGGSAREINLPKSSAKSTNWFAKNRQNGSLSL